MTNTMKTFIIVLGLLSLFTVGQAKSIEEGCSVQIKICLPEPQPLLLNPESIFMDVRGFYLPASDTGIVTIPRGKTVLLACPGNKNGFKKAAVGGTTALATCDTGTTFKVNSNNYDFSDFVCKKSVSETAEYTGIYCYDNIKHIVIGYNVEFDDGLRFYKLMDICFGDVQYNVSYVKSTIVSGIAGHQANILSKRFVQDRTKFYPRGMSVNNLYSKEKQLETISGLLGSTQLGDYYIDVTSDYYLIRGHHSAKVDYVYGSQQRATFHFVNASPQWQIINNGNWAALEARVRGYADTYGVDLEVYTGTYGFLTFPNIKRDEIELYLYVGANGKKGIPVPKLLWKVMYDRENERGVVFVTINNPYVNNPPQGDYLICTDYCSELSWVNWNTKNTERGYTYCCKVDDFRSKVPYLPQFTVRGLLTEQ